MASNTTNVVRYSALLGGIFYGFMHSRTLQKQYDEHHVEATNDRRAELIKEAREAWQKKQEDAKKPKSSLITNPDDPNFDLEKLINSWAKEA